MSKQQLVRNLENLLRLKYFYARSIFFSNAKLPCHSLPTPNLHAWKEPDRGCHFRGLAVGVGESYFPSPCTSCICTPQGVSEGTNTYIVLMTVIIRMKT
jgi:hypothetical protein